MQRINRDSCIESHLINTRNTLNKITGVANPDQIIGLLRQAFTSGMAYIHGGGKKKTPNQKQFYTCRRELCSITQCKNPLSSGSREQ